jgi:hypothetical protein
MIIKAIGQISKSRDKFAITISKSGLLLKLFKTWYEIKQGDLEIVWNFKHDLYCSGAEPDTSALVSVSPPLVVEVPCVLAISITSPGGGWSNLHVAPNLQVAVFK